MSAADPQPIVTFPEALSTRGGWLEPFLWYDRMRRESPVRYDGTREVWDVFAYEEVKAVLSDDSAFSVDPMNLPSERSTEMEESPMTETMLFTDPPEHRRLRAVAESEFRPNAVADLEPAIRRITRERVEDALSEPEFDFVADLAYPVPVIVIAELLGVPADDRDRFKSWSDTLVARPDEETREGFERLQREQETALSELQEYFAGMIDRRRTDPREDLISAVVHDEEAELTERELIGFCMLLLVAGNITTTNLLSNALRCLEGRPELTRLIVEDETARSHTVEEVLRYRSPVQAFFRVAKREADLGGQTITPGEGVVAWIGSANRDPRKFDSPDEFDPTRSPNQHIAFGHGTHYCLGAPLARLEASVVLSELFERIEGFEIRTDELQPVRSSFIYGVESLPVAVE
ncbi:cytochrome P450 [Natronorarus salvus]|uniref:cytochrome P450 n=1 Tax=Natronorarus salvus TaxID=3117733 RepID=UPI002F264A81